MGRAPLHFKGPIGQMAAFKQHVSWGFWKAKLMTDPEGILAPVGETSMGRTKIGELSELPSEKILIEYVREAVRLNEDGAKVERKKKVPAPASEVPADLLEALAKAPRASETFERFPPGQRREYVEWILEAKQEATRKKRLVTTIEWLAEGKPKNWKYMKVK